jgi:hypothetical protein
MLLVHMLVQSSNKVMNAWGEVQLFPDKIHVVFHLPRSISVNLSTRDIEVSGAIGIKFNKIMLLSP